MKQIAFLGICTAGLVTGFFADQAAGAGWSSLTGVLPAHTNLANVLISPDSQYVVFSADIEVDGRYELYSAPIAGGAVMKLNPLLVDGGSVSPWVEFSPDSNRVIYMADQEVDERRELYSVPIGGGGVANGDGVKLSLRVRVQVGA